MAAYTVVDSYVTNGLFYQRIAMDVPLSHGSPGGPDISISAMIVQKHDPAIHSAASAGGRVQLPAAPRLMAYLQGGPGFPCPVPSGKADYTAVLVERGYQVVLYDQRGTGYSSPLDTAVLQDVEAAGGTQGALEYVLHFRADSIVDDMETVRTALVGSAQWSLLGQSFGGFSIFTYLSRHAASVKEALVTGGIPPIGFSADDVYTQTYRRTAERNAHYYAKYPQDKQAVLDIMAHFRKNRTVLPNGGVLSPERFQQLGISFGASGGTDRIHQLVNELWQAVACKRPPSYALLHKLEEQTAFDTNILYALFQEAIYCDGGSRAPQKTDWAADRLRHRAENHNFVYRGESQQAHEPVFFTGEMVYRSMFDDYAQLRPLKALAAALHSNEEWSRLYDADKLGALAWEHVPIVAATYYYDQYVDFDVSMKVKGNVFKGNGNLKQYITSEYFHNGLSADPARVLGQLFKLLEGEVD